MNVPVAATDATKVMGLIANAVSTNITNGTNAVVMVLETKVVDVGEITSHLT